jgi:hypothetical protein
MILSRDASFTSDRHGAPPVIILAAILPHLKLGACREKSSFRNDIGPRFSRQRRRELPSKTIAKNIEQIITYPHSDCKRFENAAAAGSRIDIL